MNKEFYLVGFISKPHIADFVTPVFEKNSKFYVQHCFNDQTFELKKLDNIDNCTFFENNKYALRLTEMIYAINIHGIIYFGTVSKVITKIRR